MSEFWSNARAGNPLRGEVVIDCHTHMGPWFNFSIPKDPWAEGMIAAMDACGIQKVVCAPHVAIGPDAPWGNDLIAEAVRRFPDRFAGYCTVNPNYPERETLDELERHITRGTLRGVKIHPTVHLYPADGLNYRAMWAFANEHGLPVLVHTWESDRLCGPLMFSGIGKEHPKAQILLGHSGASAVGMDQSIQAAREAENVHLDLTASYMPCGMLEVIVASVGADRVLFGTDVPFLDGRPKVGQIASARISDEDKRKIFGLNAKRLFRL